MFASLWVVLLLTVCLVTGSVSAGDICLGNDCNAKGAEESDYARDKSPRSSEKASDDQLHAKVEEGLEYRLASLRAEKAEFEVTKMKMEMDLLHARAEKAELEATKMKMDLLNERVSEPIAMVLPATATTPVATTKQAPPSSTPASNNEIDVFSQFSRREVFAAIILGFLVFFGVCLFGVIGFCYADDIRSYYLLKGIPINFDPYHSTPITHRF